MKLSTGWGFFLVAAVLTVTSVQAGVFTDALSYDGVPDTIRDNSVALALFDNNLDGILNQGDAIGGLLKWNDNITTGADVQNTALTVFAAEVLTGPTPTWDIAGHHGLRFTLGPVTTDPSSTLAALLPNQSAANGGFAANTMGAFFSAPNGTNLTTVSVANALSALDNTATWKLDMSFGKRLPSDSFVVDLADANNDGKVNFTEYAAFNPGDRIGYEAGAFSVIVNKLGGSLVPVAANDLDHRPLTGDVLLLPSTTLSQPTAEQGQNGYIYSAQATALVNVVPEPASLLLLGSWLATVACYGLCQRRKGD